MSKNGAGATVHFVNVTKSYGTLEALHTISIEIEAGEFFSIIGPSGSGKTTLLGVTAGYIPPSSGQILVNGKDIVGVPPYRRNIGMVFQNYSLFPHMSVSQNVGFPLRMRKLAKSDIAERVDRILAMVRLSGLGERRPTQLSGGQQQRVALARAAIYDPLLLLMDEPLSALDKNLRESMQDEIKQFQAVLGSTVLYVTHDQVEAAAMSHRIAIMNHGRLEQVGTPRDLYEHPANRFVASFLGEANLFGLTEVVAHASGARMLTRNGFTLVSSMAPKDGAQCACVRPETMSLSTTRVEADNSVGGKIVDATYTTGSIRYQIQLTPDQVVTKRLTSARGEDVLAPGTLVHLHWRAEDTLLVDDGE